MNSKILYILLIIITLSLQVSSDNQTIDPDPTTNSTTLKEPSFTENKTLPEDTKLEYAAVSVKSTRLKYSKIIAIRLDKNLSIKTSDSFKIYFHKLGEAQDITEEKLDQYVNGSWLDFDPVAANQLTQDQIYTLKITGVTEPTLKSNKFLVELKIANTSIFTETWGAPSYLPEKIEPNEQAVMNEHKLDLTDDGFTQDQKIYTNRALYDHLDHFIYLVNCSDNQNITINYEFLEGSSVDSRDLYYLSENGWTKTGQTLELSEPTIFMQQYRTKINAIVNEKFNINISGDKGFSAFMDPVIWWNKQYFTYTPFTIQENNGTDQIDYQVNITFNSSELTNFNCTQIRFSNSSADQIDHWVENETTCGNDTYNLTIWVEVPIIPASSTETIYMWYHTKDQVSNTSNGTLTFPFFDDFLGTAYDSNRWEWWQNGAGASVVVLNSIMNITPEDPGVPYKTFLNSTNYLSTPNTVLRIRARLSPPNPTTEAYPGYACDIGGTSPRMYPHNSGTTMRYYLNSEQNWSTQGVDKFHVFEIIRNGTSNVIFYTDSGNKTIFKDDIPSPTDAMNILLSVTQSGGTGKPLSVDWVMVRKYVENEPTITSIGAEGFGAPNITSMVLNITKPHNSSDICFNVTNIGINTSYICEYMIYNSTTLMYSGNTTIQNNTDSTIYTLTYDKTDHNETWNFTVRCTWNGEYWSHDGVYNSSDQTNVTIHAIPLLQNTSLVSSGYTDTAYPICIDVLDLDNDTTSIVVDFADPDTTRLGNFSMTLTDNNTYCKNYTFTKTTGNATYSDFNFHVTDADNNLVSNTTNNLSFVASVRPATTTTVSTGGQTGGATPGENGVEVPEYLIHFRILPTVIKPSDIADFLPGNSFFRVMRLENQETFQLDFRVGTTCGNESLCAVPLCNLSGTDNLTLQGNAYREFLVECAAPTNATEGTVYYAYLNITGCRSDDPTLCDQRAARIILPIRKAQQWIYLEFFTGLFSSIQTRVSNFNIPESFKAKPHIYIIAALLCLFLGLLIAWVLVIRFKKLENLLRFSGLKKISRI